MIDYEEFNFGAYGGGPINEEEKSQTCFIISRARWLIWISENEGNEGDKMTQSTRGV